MPSHENEFFIDGTTLIRCNPDIVSAKIPDNITKIGKEAFKECKNLESVELPEALEEICEGAFELCQKLSAIKIPSKVKTIPKRAFYDCKELALVDLPEGLTTIGIMSFFRCKKLKELKLPQTLRTIASKAFHSSGLTTIEVPESVDDLQFDIFSYCKSLKKIKLPSVCDLWGDMFTECSSLESIIIPSPAKEGINLTEKAFDGCTSLSSVEYLEGADIVSHNLFENLKNLKTIKLPSTLKKISFKAFNGCTGLESIDLPEGLEAIFDEAFYACSGLKSVTLPSTIRFLGAGVFSRSGVQEVHFNGTMAEWLKYVEKPKSKFHPWIYLDEIICKDEMANAHKKDARVKIDGGKNTSAKKKTKDAPALDIDDIIDKMTSDYKNVSCIPYDHKGVCHVMISTDDMDDDVLVALPEEEFESWQKTLPGLLEIIDSGADLNAIKDYMDKNGLKE